MHLHRSLSLAAALIAGHVVSSTRLRLGPRAGIGATLESSLERSWESLRPFLAPELRSRSGAKAAAAGPGYAVFGNHKHASSLMGSIAGSLCHEAGVPFHHFGWATVHDAAENPSDGTAEPVCGEVNYYEDMRAPVMKYILKKCPGIRVVRVNRKPTDTVESDYVFTKHLQPGEEVEALVHFGEILRNISLTDGLHALCKSYTETYAPQALDVHQSFQANSKSETNLLEIEFNDFKDNYNATIRKIFAHWVGEDSLMLESLVSRASEWDLTSPWGHNVAENQHVSPVEEKAQAFQEMKMQFKRGDPCMEKVRFFDEQMGYNSPLEG